MDFRQNRLTYLRQLSSVKRGRTLTISRGAPLHRLLARRRRRAPIPYPRGRRGGYLVPFAVIDGRRGHEYSVTVVLEMYPPTRMRPHYLPVDLELTLLQMSALTRWAPTTCYRRCKAFQSIRYRGNRIYFDRDQFFDEDWPLLDNARARDERPAGRTTGRNARAGRHRKDCASPASHTGKCPRATGTRRASRAQRGTRRGGRRWTAEPKRARPPHGVVDAAVQDDPTCSAVEAPLTLVEGRLLRLAGGNPELFASLREEYSDEVDADRAAGRFGDAPTPPHGS